ncbi:MAG: hypothetical protein M0R74_18395, partial [Dehalococcoidia bacterium]|nr:hypothetical protein [Dehalococcoidia bacterium]
DIAECYLDDRYHLDQEESEANARLIAATHNGFPAALGDIEKDLELADAMILGGSYWEKTAQGFISRKLALLEALAREFGVEEPHE